MEVQLDHPVEDDQRLRRCMDDLSKLLALRAMLGAGPSSPFVRVLLDTLVEMLDLNFAYVRVKGSSDAGLTEIARGAAGHPVGIHDIGKALGPWLELDPARWPRRIVHPCGRGELSIVVLPLGLEGSGVLVAASRRSAFPAPTERLVLGVAADQATIDLQEVRLRSEQDAVLTLERRLGHDINAIPMVAWRTLPDGQVEFLSQLWMEYTGLSLDEGRGWGWTVTIHPDDLSKLATTWQGVLASGQPGQVEARLRRSDGVYRWFLIRANPLRDESGNVLRWYGTHMDIDDQKRAAQELRRSEAFLAEGQRLSLTGSFAWCPQTDEMTWSEQLYRLYEFEPGTHVTGEQISSRIHPDDLAFVNDRIGPAVRSGDDWEIEYRLRMPDGSVKFVHIVAHGTRDQQGLLEYIGGAQDVTRRRQAEESLGKARTDLARVARVTSLGALAASIAHEVSQPLSGIIANVNTCLLMLAKEPPNVEFARESARRSLRDGSLASDVIARLRALFARKPPVMVSFDLNEATREVIALSLNELQSGQVALRTELCDDVPPVEGDRIQLQQVILNLLRNASDAMCEIHDRPRQLVVGTARDDGDSVRVTVQDAGVGLKSQEMDRLFRPFYTTKKSGMGIGLSLSRTIIENHQGRLWASANEGHGATFSFSIPRRAEPTP